MFPVTEFVGDRVPPAPPWATAVDRDDGLIAVACDARLATVERAVFHARAKAPGDGLDVDVLRVGDAEFPKRLLGPARHFSGSCDSGGGLTPRASKSSSMLDTASSERPSPLRAANRNLRPVL